MARPIIGISCMNSANPGGALMAVRPNYLRALEAAGAAPLLIPLTDELEVVQTLYQLCAGILLPGGDDLDPALFDEPPHPQLGKVDPQRDAVEIALARWCQDDQKPLLGICRGIQTINVAFGGSLYQDIPSQLPGSLDHRHNTHLGVYDVAAHALQLSEDSWLAGQLGATEVLANTMHHQAIKALAPGLRIVGHAPDGIVEAVEGTTDHFVVAVQCHPEHLWDRAEPRWHKVFRAFVDHCR
ncbi:MAG: gamma-glutamyl-gamma-aminobutyrate hydrolase family protein [Oscillochloridaceae bacterium umkhey_bin13]